MTDRTDIGNNATDLTTSEELVGVSKIICWIDDETFLAAGNDTGYTMEVTCPFATQAIVEAMLARVQGYQYQPYNASSAALNPATELGDAVTVGDVYGGLYTQSTSFGGAMRSDISAPMDMEVEHEFEYKDSTTRKYGRQFADLRASLTITNASITAEVAARTAQGEDFETRISATATALTSEITAREGAESALSSRIDQTATEISAKVSSTHNSSSFGWKLLSTGFEVNAGNETVFKIDSSGAEVKGKITADSGSFSCWTISNDAIRYGAGEHGTDTNPGIYFGTGGLYMGEYFTVSPGGSVMCHDLTCVGGSVYCKTLEGGTDQYGYVGSGVMSSGVLGSLAGGDIANAMFSLSYGGWLLSIPLVSVTTSLTAAQIYLGQGKKLRAGTDGVVYWETA